jgi:hypothetical protein
MANNALNCYDNVFWNAHCIYFPGIAHLCALWRLACCAVVDWD